MNNPYPPPIIKDRKTLYSEIGYIEVDGDIVSYSETYNLNHPDCPVVKTLIDGERLVSISIIRKLPKIYFELLYGGLEPEIQKNQETKACNKNE